MPADDDGVDLGSSSLEFRDLYLDGTTYTDALGFGTTSMTLPTSDGTSGQVLKTDGQGTLSWTSTSGITQQQADAIVSNSAKVAGASATEIGYLSGVTSSIQTQINALSSGAATDINSLSDAKITTADSTFYLGNIPANSTGKNNTAIGLLI